MRQYWMLAGALAMLWLAGCPAGAGERALVLAKEGKSDYRIALQPAAGEVERFASEELRKYLMKITGAELPIIEARKQGKGLILIRAIERPERPRVPILPNADSCTIDVRADGITLTGQTPRAALYAVYAFLEELGCRWLAPSFSFYAGIGNEVVPLKPSVSLDPRKTTSSPSFLYRKKGVEEGRSHNTENLIQLVDWMAKAKVNIFNCPMDYKHRGVEWDNWRVALTPELKKRGMIIGGGGHGYQNYLKPELYFKDHPDWFGMAENGQRTESQNMVFNTANPEALAKLGEEVVNYLKAHPEISILDLWPPDGAKWSVDEASKAQGPMENRQAAVLTYVDAAIHKAGLPVMLQGIAYHLAKSYPKGVELPADLMMDLCPATRNFACDENDTTCQANLPFYQYEQEWTKNFKGIFGIYSYYRKYYWISKPVILPTRIPREADYYHSIGVQGVSSYAEPADWFTYEYQHYMLGKILWDHKLDSKSLLADYCDHRYGPAAKTVAQYFLTMEPVASGEWAVFDTKPGNEKDLAKLEEGHRKARHLLRKAFVEAAGNTTVSEALSRLGVGCDYVGRDLDICRLYLKGDRAGIELKLKELEAFFAANGANGVILLKDRTSGDRLRAGYKQLLQMPVATEDQAQ